MWMECDDLKHPLCQFQDKEPQFPPSQVHVVMWTRKNIHTNMPPVAKATAKATVLPKPVPLKSVLKAPKDTHSLGETTKRKVSLEDPVSQRHKKLVLSPKSKAKTVTHASKTASSDNAANSSNNAMTREKEVKTAEMSRQDLIAKLISVPKRPSVSERIERIENMRAEFRMRQKMNSLKPAELAKHILSHGLIPGLSKPLPATTNYSPISESSTMTSIASTSTFGRRGATVPSFTGYVPKMQGTKADTKSILEKSSSRKAAKTTNPAIDVSPWMMPAKYKRGKKRKYEESQLSPVKHVKISETNVIIGPDAPVHKPVSVLATSVEKVTHVHSAGESFSMEINPPSVNEVLGELCEKLEIPSVDACNKESEGFSLEDLFDSGKEGERIKPIESSIHENFDFNLDMFV